VDKENSVLKNGDDRVWFEAADAENVSILAVLVREDDGQLVLHQWEDAASLWYMDIGAVERGSVDATKMLRHEQQFTAEFVLLCSGCLLCLGMWVLLWPFDFLVCFFSGCQCDASCCWRCMSTGLRAVFLGIVLASLARYGGWLRYGYGTKVAVVVLCFIYGTAGAVEICLTHYVGQLDLQGTCLGRVSSSTGYSYAQVSQNEEMAASVASVPSQQEMDNGRVEDHELGALFCPQGSTSSAPIALCSKRNFLRYLLQILAPASIMLLAFFLANGYFLPHHYEFILMKLMLMFIPGPG